VRVEHGIYNGLIRHIESEIQAGRRHVDLDPGIVAMFLAMDADAPSSAAGGAMRPMAPPAGAATLDDLAAGIAQCRACALCNDRTQTAPGVGNPHAPDVMIVGERPVEDEDGRLMPFSGEAGDLLEKMIAAMGYAPDDVFITTIVKCPTPNGRLPDVDEIRACSPWLEKQIALVRPKCLIAMGTGAFRGLARDMTANVTKMRGVWHKHADIPLMPTFHPDHLLKYATAKRGAWEDLKKVLAALGKPVPTPRKTKPH
jgi:uracil-DNA glycosylase family 4